MQIMVTITHNNRSPEMLAAVRRRSCKVDRHECRRSSLVVLIMRGPFAPPTSQEKIEYLLTRTRKTETRKYFEKHALEHVNALAREVFLCIVVVVCAVRGRLSTSSVFFE